MFQKLKTENDNLVKQPFIIKLGVYTIARFRVSAKITIPLLILWKLQLLCLSLLFTVRYLTDSKFFLYNISKFLAESFVFGKRFEMGSNNAATLATFIIIDLYIGILALTAMIFIYHLIKSPRYISGKCKNALS